jgi:hypothetical protein
MDIFKLFFHHDLRLDQLNEEKNESEDGTLEDFMTPTLTFSRFYLTGTLLEDEIIGLDRLENYTSILQQLDHAFNSYESKSADSPQSPVSTQLKQLQLRHAMILTPRDAEKPPVSAGDLARTSTDISSINDELQELLQSESVILFKEEAQHGFDIQILCRDNIYELFFNAFRTLLSDNFRFFSINSKRINSRKKFFFELNSLQRPPHGAEEVQDDTVLYS